MPPPPEVLAPPDEGDKANKADKEAEIRMVDGVEVEVIRERYPDRSVKVERHVTQDGQRNYINHGPWTLWDRDGNMLAQGEYWNGKRHGPWTRWFFRPELDAPTDAPETGSPQSETAFSDPWYEGFEKPFASEATFVDGKLVGKWTIVDAEGRSISSWEFDHDQLHGKAISWHPNGEKRQEVDYVHGIVDGRWLEWDSDARLTREDTYIQGRKHFQSVTRSPSGEKLAEGWVLAARERPQVTLDWWKGIVNISSGGTPEGRNRKHGRWTQWHPNGGKRYEGEFVKGQPVGPHVWWYANGQREVAGEYIAGNREGVWTFWHPNGQKHTEGAFTAGVPFGTWIRWSPDGRVYETRKHSTAHPAPSFFPGMQRISSPRITAPPPQHFRRPVMRRGR